MLVNVGGCIVAPPACRHNVGELLRPKSRKVVSIALRALTARRTALSQKDRGAFVCCFLGGSVSLAFFAHFVANAFGTTTTAHPLSKRLHP